MTETEVNFPDSAPDVLPAGTWIVFHDDGEVVRIYGFGPDEQHAINSAMRQGGIPINAKVGQIEEALSR